MGAREIPQHRTGQLSVFPEDDTGLRRCCDKRLEVPAYAGNL